VNRILKLKQLLLLLLLLLLLKQQQKLTAGNQPARSIL
jgi:hypothetical protein